jgi:hypothetical protein
MVRFPISIRWVWPVLALVLAPLFLEGQNGPVLNNYHRFNDGLYSSLSDFLRDTPRWHFREISPVEYWINADSNELHLAYKAPVTDQHAQPLLDSLWGVSLFGIPYVRVSRDESRTKVIFARLHVVGKLCYLYYEGVELQTFDMKVYHPITGDVLSSHPVQNRVRVVKQKFLRAESGELSDFTPENFALLIADDPQLLRTLEALSAPEAREKLFKMLLIYNDRHPFYLPSK